MKRAARWVCVLLALMLFAPALAEAGLDTDGSPLVIDESGERWIDPSEPLPDGAQEALAALLRPGESRDICHETADRLLVTLYGADASARLVTLTRSGKGWLAGTISAVFPVLPALGRPLLIAWGSGGFEVQYKYGTGYREYGFVPEGDGWSLSSYTISDQYDQPGPDLGVYCTRYGDRGVLLRRTEEGSFAYEDSFFYPGSLPGDATTVDIAALPTDQESLARALWSGETAIVHNPVDTDRLHLRARPDRESESLGKFYNGTVVYISAYVGEWARVTVGGRLEGYMMREYLAVGDEVGAAKACYLERYATPYDVPALLAANGGVILGWPDASPAPMTLYAHSEGNAPLVQIPYATPVVLLGVYGDERVIVEADGWVGYADARNVWAGNG